MYLVRALFLDARVRKKLGRSFHESKRERSCRGHGQHGFFRQPLVVVVFEMGQLVPEDEAR